MVGDGTATPSSWGQFLRNMQTSLNVLINTLIQVFAIKTADTLSFLAEILYLVL